MGQARQKRKKLTTPPDARASSAHHHLQWALVVLAALTFISTAPPVYWSYICRTTGKLCEGSFVATGAAAANRDRVDRLLSNPADRDKLARLSIVKRGIWPWSERYDVVAYLSDGSNLVVDTINNGSRGIAINQQQDNISALVTNNAGGSRSIVLYDYKNNLTRRDFAISCESESTAEIEIGNVFIDRAAQTLFADIQSACPVISVNNNLSVDIRKTKNDSQPFGDTLIIELLPSLHARQAYTLSRDQELKKSEAEYQGCLAKLSKAGGKEGEVSACFRERNDRDLISGPEIVILEWTAGKLQEVSTAECFGSFLNWSRSQSHRAVLSICRFEIPGNDRKTNYIEVYRKPFERIKVYELEWSCEDFMMFNADLPDGRMGVEFELETTCDSVKVDGIEFYLPGLASSKRQGIFVIHTTPDHRVLNFGEKTLIAPYYRANSAATPQ